MVWPIQQEADAIIDRALDLELAAMRRKLNRLAKAQALAWNRLDRPTAWTRRLGCLKAWMSAGAIRRAAGVPDGGGSDGREGVSVKVYQKIAAVAGALAKDGISKARENTQQGYNFRGIDDVYNALAPFLAEHGLVILPRVLGRSVVERVTQKGGVLFYVTVEVEFDFVCAEDASRHTVKTFGEAMDSADKATNKAMSAAYKYACMQAFCIPTEGDNDADSTTHEVLAKAPEGYDDWLIDLEAKADEGTAALQATWKASAAELRKHLTETNKKKWDDIKAKAEKVPQMAGAA